MDAERLDHLGLPGKPPEGPAVEHSGAVALERRATRPVLGFGNAPVTGGVVVGHVTIQLRRRAAQTTP